MIDPIALGIAVGCGAFVYVMVTGLLDILLKRRKGDFTFLP